MIHPTLTLACSILFMIHHAHSQPGGMGQGMPGQGNMGMPPMGGMGGMGMGGMGGAGGGGGGAMPGGSLSRQMPQGAMPAMNSIPGMAGVDPKFHNNPDYGGGPPGGQMPPGGMGGGPGGGQAPPGMGMPGGGGGMGGMGGMPMGGDQGMGGQGRGQNRAGPAMAGAMGQGGRGEYGVIQTAGPAMEGGHEEEMPLDRHLTQIIYKVDGALQTLDQGVHMARKRGGNVQLELNEGTHTITNTLKVGSGQGEETWKGIVVNFHDLSILGQGIQKTIVYGGIKSYKSTHLIIKDLTVTAPLNGSAFYIEGSDVHLHGVEVVGSHKDGMTIQEGTVTLIDVEIHKNSRRGIFVCGFETQLIANNIHVHDNFFHGLDVVAGAKVELYGKNTNFHSNGIHGIVIEFHSHVEIYLDEKHETFVNNIGNETSVEEGSSLTYKGYQEL